MLCRPQGWTRCYNNRPSKLLKRMSSTNVQCLHVSYCLKSSTGEILTISMCQVHRIVHNQYINMFTMSIYSLCQYVHNRCQVHRIVHNRGRVNPRKGGRPDLDKCGHCLQGDDCHDFMIMLIKMFMMIMMIMMIMLIIRGSLPRSWRETFKALRWLPSLLTCTLRSRLSGGF